MNADSISMLTTCAFLVFYEFKDNILFSIIVTSLYAIYPDVVKFECYGLYLIFGAVYLILVKLLLRSFEKQNSPKGEGVRMVFKKQEANLDEAM
jgi:hypothetical protein